MFCFLNYNISLNRPSNILKTYFGLYVPFLSDVIFDFVCQLASAIFTFASFLKKAANCLPHATIMSLNTATAFLAQLTHWGRVTHICVAYLTIIASDNDLSPSRRQAISWTNAGILLIRPLGTNFSKILMKIHTFSLTKMHLKMSSAKRGPFCLGLNVWNMRYVRVGDM